MLCREGKPWCELNKLLVASGKKVMSTSGDGFCLLNAIQNVLLIEKDEVIDVAEAIDEIIEHVQENSREYTVYHHIDQDREASHEEVLDKLLKDLKLYMHSGNPDSDVCDLLVKAASKALHINIHIYYKMLGKVAVNRQDHCQNPNHVVHVLFRRFQATKPGHYDAIIFPELESDSESDSENEAMPSSMPSLEKNARKVTGENLPPKDVIDLTSDSPVKFTSPVQVKLEDTKPPRKLLDLPEKPILIEDDYDDQLPNIPVDSDKESDNVLPTASQSNCYIT